MEARERRQDLTLHRDPGSQFPYLSTLIIQDRIPYLRAAADHHSSKTSSFAGVFEADARIRTADLLITNQLLYQLSYVGTCRL
jgi:hypothetical protein